MFNKAKRYIRDPYYSLGYDMIKKCPNLMPDKYYVSVLWKMVMGYKLDWKHLKTFNEKLQWLKLYDHNPQYTTLVDKYRVKQWVADKIGEQYVIPTLAVYRSVDEIDLDKLPEQFVLKCNHDSGSVAICRDKSSFDLDAAKAKLDKGLKHNFYWDAREWPYKNVKRCVFSEQFMKDSTMDDNLTDRKLSALDIEPKIIQVDFSLFKWHKYKLYGSHWSYIETQIQHLNQPDDEIDLQRALEEMQGLCRKLGEHFGQVGVDFYLINDKVYFAEMTVHHDCGWDCFGSEEFGLQFVDYIELPGNKRFERGGIFVNNHFVVYLHSESTIPSFVGLKDYKWFCFSGEPKVMYIANDRAEFPTMNFYNMDFEPLPLYTKDPPAFDNPPKPKRFEEMESLASKLSSGIPQVRVDFYENDTGLFFGEMTLYHGGGLSEVHPKEWNIKMGDWIKLPMD